MIFERSQSAETPKYCRHYNCLFPVITITELRYAALTLTLMNVEKGFHSLTKKKLTEIEPRSYSK